ncbi:MAG: alpha/beta hydrolase [Woeseia sp.]
MNIPSVVLLHGIWMPAGEMLLFRHWLDGGDQFSSRLFGYPSVAATLDENADRLHEYLVREGLRDTHLVGHSLGGVVALRMLSRYPAAANGRVVCLGSPLSGSRPAAYLYSRKWGRTIIGRSLPQLVADQPARDWARAVAKRREIGIIAGTTPAGLGRLLTRFDGPNDGTVAVSETMLDGARDHLCMPVNHTGMVLSKAVALQTAAFLNHGAFLR